FRSFGYPDEVRTATVSPSGTFAFTDLPRRFYTLHVKGAKYLASNLTVNTAAGDVSGMTAMLRAGDCDDNNVVDIEDLGLLARASQPASGVPLYDPQRDLNGDGEVDMDDLGLLALYFNEAGDP